MSSALKLHTLSFKVKPDFKNVPKTETITKTTV